MDSLRKKLHWENIFQTKDTTKVSWYQPLPKTSLDLIEELKLEKHSNIIEVGAGDSFMADHLLKKGFTKITLLDISQKALHAIKERLKEDSGNLKFIASDICDFSKPASYSLWHDRAVFHFLFDEKDKKNYLKNVSETIVPGGYLIISTFSDEGPKSCSGLEVQRYSEDELNRFFRPHFERIKSFKVDHITPSGSVQNFVYAVFKRK